MGHSGTDVPKVELWGSTPTEYSAFF